MKKNCLLGFALILSAFLAGSVNAKKGTADGGDSVTAETAGTTSAGSGSHGGGVGTNSPYFIPVDSANKMLQSYLTSINADADTGMNLQSLIIDADALRTYLSDSSIKKVKVMFAHTLDYINSGHSGQNCGYRSGQLTIVLAGFDSDNNYVFIPGSNGGKVLNRAFPCPASCPQLGTASDMLLH